MPFLFSEDHNNRFAPLCGRTIGVVASLPLLRVSVQKKLIRQGAQVFSAEKIGDLSLESLDAIVLDSEEGSISTIPAVKISHPKETELMPSLRSRDLVFSLFHQTLLQKKILVFSDFLFKHMRTKKEKKFQNQEHISQQKPEK